MQRAAVFLILFHTYLALAQYQQQQRYNSPQQQLNVNQPYNQRIQANQGGYQNGQQRNNMYQANSGFNGNTQQQGFNQQGMNYQMGAQGSQVGRTVVVNSPIKLQSDSSVSSAMGAQVNFQLTAYSNPNFIIANGTTCSCPSSTYCNYLQSDNQNDCSFSFTTVIAARDQSVQYIQSDFYPFAGQISAGNWTNPYSFQMPSKPISIDVFVQHLGVVIDSATASLLFFNHLMLVDSFVVDLSKYTPTNSQNTQTYTLTGKRLGTQLQMNLNIQCINGMQGDMCDLTCSKANNTNSNYVVCTDSENRNVSCLMNNYNGQLSQCQICNQIGSNGTCSTMLTTEQVGVSYAFRTWTIVLGCLLGIAVLFILCLIISYIIIKNRESKEDEAAAYKNPQFANGKSANRPLLDDEWNTSPRRPTELDRNTEDSYSPRNVVSSSRQEHQV